MRLKQSPFILTGLIAIALATNASAQILINELDSDTSGTDVAEFIELFNAGVSEVSLSGSVIVFYNGSNDLSYFSLDLTGTVAPGGFYLIGNPGVAGANQTFSSTTSGLQNGQDAVALYTGTAASFPTGTAVTTTGLLDALVYDTNDADDAGLLALTPGQPQINEGDPGASDLFSIGRATDGLGGALVTSGYTQQTPTPGLTNVPEPTAALALFSGAGILLARRRRSSKTVA